MNDLKLTRSPWFLGSLLAKLLIGCCLISTYCHDIFIPVTNYLLAHPLGNPYAHFDQIGIPHAFPYPALMLIILYIPKLLLSWMPLPPDYLDALAIRLPLLIADVAIFAILLSWLRPRYSQACFRLYWLSPVLFYISYVHGQLDSIPMAWLLASLYALFKQQDTKAAILLGLAISTKTHIAITLPLFYLYQLSNQHRVIYSLRFTLISIATFCLINAPFITDPAFYHMVLHNPEQQKLLQSSVQMGNTALYIIPACLIIVLVQSALLPRQNRDVLVILMGLSFASILLFVVPMPGWYYWCLPFLSYFYSKQPGRAPRLLIALQVSYICYFLVIPQSDYLSVLQLVAPQLATYQPLYYHLSFLGIHPTVIEALAYTGLQATLLLNILWLYTAGLKPYSQQKLATQPFMLGIGGNAGAGKTTIAEALAEIYRPNRTTLIRGDAMHKWQRHDHAWERITHLNPKANHLHQEIAALSQLKRGKPIHRRDYDHHSGTFTPAALVTPSNLIIYEGLHPFFLQAQRQLYDLKIYIAPDSELNQHWHIQRDMQERGHDRDSILARIHSRQQDYQQYITDQADQADIVINVEALENPTTNTNLRYKVIMQNSLYLDPLLVALDRIPTLMLTHEYTGVNQQTLLISGHCEASILGQIAYQTIPYFADTGMAPPSWKADSFGVVLLVLSYHIYEQAQHENARS
jgi:uridine kinase